MFFALIILVVLVFIILSFLFWPDFSSIVLVAISSMILAIACCLLSRVPNNDIKKKIVILVSVDGLSNQFLYDNLHILPTFYKLIHSNCYGKSITVKHGVRPVIPSVTYPNHTTIITGKRPSEHNILNNTVFDPQYKKHGAWYWYGSDIKCATLYDYFHAKGLCCMNVQWPVTAGLNIDYSIPQIWQYNNLDDLKLIQAVTHPHLDLMTLLEKAKLIQSLRDMNDLHSIKGDGLRVKIACEWLRKYKPGFSTIYLGSLDHAEHEYGPDSPVILEVLKQIDTLIAQIVETALSVFHGDDITFCIVSDHGFDNVHTEVFLDILLDGNKNSLAVWPADGCAAIQFTSAKAEKANAEKVLRILESLPEIQQIMNRDELKEAKTFPDAAFVIGFKSGYMCGVPNPENTLPYKSSTTKGTHGYLPDTNQKMNAFFLLRELQPSACKHIPYESMNMQDIASLLVN